MTSRADIFKTPIFRASHFKRFSWWNFKSSTNVDNLSTVSTVCFLYGCLSSSSSVVFSLLASVYFVYLELVCLETGTEIFCDFSPVDWYFKYICTLSPLNDVPEPCHVVIALTGCITRHGILLSPKGEPITLHSRGRV